MTICTACLLVIGACAEAPPLPTESAVRVAVLDPAGTELRDLADYEVAWVQSVLASCSWRRYWVTRPVPEATLSFQAPGAEPVRVDFMTGGVIGTNPEGDAVSCHLGSTPGYYMGELLAGTWQPPDPGRELQ